MIFSQHVKRGTSGRWVCTLCVALSCVGSWGQLPAEAAAAPPNIVLIMADDLGYECLGCNGARDYQTPHLDRLADTGMRFTHCYSQPICTPSRVQLMTGQYNFRNYSDFGILRTDQVTFANLLRDRGYATAIVGKWQLAGDAATVRHFGFDRHCLWHIGGRDSRYWEPRLVEDGEVRADVSDRFGPDVVCDYALQFMEEYRHQPFLLYYPAMLTHFPYVPTPDSAPGGSRERSGRYDGTKGGEEYFDDMVTYLDKLVGRIVQRLDELKLRERTVVIFTSDNGCTPNIVTRWRDGTVRGGKATLPDAGTHAPCIANWPGHVPEGQVTDALVDFTDFLPTLAEAAGITDLPRDVPWDGVSFWPVLTQNGAGGREWVFCHYRRNAVPSEPEDAVQRREAINQQAQQREAKKLGRFARTQHYKLYDDGRFYHVAVDRLEQHVIEAGQGSPDAEAAREMLQSVHASMPPWQTFRGALP